MSLDIICEECKTTFAEFDGKDGKENKNTENIFVVGRLQGNMGATFDNTTIPIKCFVCKNCLKIKLTEIYVTLIEKEMKTKLIR